MPTSPSGAAPAWGREAPAPQRISDKCVWDRTVNCVSDCVPRERHFLSASVIPTSGMVPAL